MSSRCLGTQWCGDDVLGRASSEQSQGHRVDKKLNAPTVPCPQTNIWMSEPPPPKKEGYRDQRGAMAVSGLTSEPLDYFSDWRHSIHDIDAQTGVPQTGLYLKSLWYFI